MSAKCIAISGAVFESIWAEYRWSHLMKSKLHPPFASPREEASVIKGLLKEGSIASKYCLERGNLKEARRRRGGGGGGGRRRKANALRGCESSSAHSLAHLKKVLCYFVFIKL